MPMVILLVLAIVWGVGGYVGSNQAIGSRPEWRKMIHSPAEYNLSSETVTLQSTDGIQLKAWWLPAQGETAGIPESLPAVNLILAHGRDMNRSGMLPRAAFLVRHGYNVLDLDLRDHGESGGGYITPGYCEAFDVMGGVAHVRSRGERGPIVVLGYSYGAVAALHAGAQCSDVSGVIADSAFITPDEILKNVAHHKGIPLKYKVGIWVAQAPLLDRSVDFFFRMRTGVELDREKISAIAAAKRIYNQAVLYISGVQDWLAPPGNARLIYEETPATRKEILFVPGDHNTTYSGAPELYETKVLAFLGRYVPRQVMAQSRCRPE